MSGRFLLDTHIFIWWADEPARLSRRTRELLEAPENDLYLSIASAWEIAIKEAVGKLSLGATVYYAVDKAGVELLPISLNHIERTKQLPLLHRDPFDRMLVAQAIEEAQTLVPRPKLILFAAFQFDPEAARDIDETNWPGVTLLKAQMNADLLTDDLKKKRASSESFWLIGQPDLSLRQIHRGEHQGKWELEVYGFDYYNTRTGTIESGSARQIAVWLLDTDYDGRSIFPRQVFFPQASENDGWARLAKNLKAEIDEELIEAYRGTLSLPFELGNHSRVAVKIVDDRGVESLKVIGVT